jgi:hypothetical protein
MGGMGLQTSRTPCSLDRRACMPDRCIPAASALAGQATDGRAPAYRDSGYAPHPPRSSPHTASTPPAPLASCPSSSWSPAPSPPPAGSRSPRRKRCRPPVAAECRRCSGSKASRPSSVARSPAPVRDRTAPAGRGCSTPSAPPGSGGRRVLPLTDWLGGPCPADRQPAPLRAPSPAAPDGVPCPAAACSRAAVPARSPAAVVQGPSLARSAAWVSCGSAPHAPRSWDYSFHRAPGYKKPAHDINGRGRFHLLLPAAGVAKQS